MLGLLQQLGPINGNGLSRCADVMIGEFWTLTRSQVYRELQSLEEDGLIEGGAVGPRASREFSITARGREALQAWLDRGPVSDVIRFPILLTMRFAAGLETPRLRAILEDFAARHREKREYYALLEEDMRRTRNDPFELSTIRFGRLFEAAISTWIEELPEMFPDAFPDGPPSGRRPPSE